MPALPGHLLEVGIGCHPMGVEHLLDQTFLQANAELADEAGVIARLPEQGRIADPGQALVQRRFREGISVSALVEARQDTGAARSADRGGHERSFEPDAPGGQGVHVGSLYDRVAGAPEGVRALVVGKEQDYVRLLPGRMAPRAPRSKGQRSRSQDGSPKELFPCYVT